ncbi:DNA-binding transcriptional regulator, AcrR family [Nonomuraea solani]|uniref:DNA-binding transcriptional regulator, AcrR family n=1 Tax=Nonomuraea solani TaxID=1144553 RepID=A0A1H5W1E2_9ACTN|nr:TetR/AcrR family transcriptional regulator [Nonomuraea solani]SEF93334.1 DNA-binding transcriptional regulator, AcrR family [Nonomuraea solani]
MTTTGGLRADARRNREKLVEAARDLIAEHGTEVSLDDVARRAGVGVGTVYRRFPHRQALVQAVALDDLRRVVDTASTAEAEEPDGWGALGRFVRAAGDDLPLASRLSAWFAPAWDAPRTDPENLRLRRSLLRALDRMVARAQAEGAVRADLTGGDLALLLARVLRPLPGLPDGMDDTDRHLALVLDGLRPGAPLPGRGPSFEDLDVR